MYNDKYRSTPKGKKTTQECQERMNEKMKKSQSNLGISVYRSDRYNHKSVNSATNIVEPARADCEGVCELNSCADCKYFYGLEDHWPQWKVHPYYERMGLPLPEKWPRDNCYREDYENDEAMCGTRYHAGNEYRKHPLLVLLQEAYEFVVLPEPVGEVGGPAAGVRMPTIKEAMAMPCSRLCTVRPRNERAWRSFCNGPWSGSTGYDAYGFCKRCSVLGPATRMREALQEEAEVQLHAAMLASARAWHSSFKEGAAGAEWRRRFKAQLQERVARRAAAAAIAARAARVKARAWYAERSAGRRA